VPLNPEAVFLSLIQIRKTTLSGCHVCHTCAAFFVLGDKNGPQDWAGPSAGDRSNSWLVRVHVGRDPETRRRKYIGKFIHGGLRSAHRPTSTACLRNETLVATFARSDKPLANTLIADFAFEPGRACDEDGCRDYSCWLRRYVRPPLGPRPLVELSPAEIQIVYRELLNRKLSARCNLARSFSRRPYFPLGKAWPDSSAVPLPSIKDTNRSAWPPGNCSSKPPGQRISMRSKEAAEPSPKWRRGSLVDR